MNNNTTERFRKDEKVQIYYVKQIPGSRPARFSKHYIYSQEQYDRGGLWAYVRDTSTAEQLAGAAVDRELSIRFIVNFNPKLAENVINGLFIEYRPTGALTYNTYLMVGEPDRFEYGINDFTLNARKRTPIEIAQAEDNPDKPTDITFEE